MIDTEPHVFAIGSKRAYTISVSSANSRTSTTTMMSDDTRKTAWYPGLKSDSDKLDQNDENSNKYRLLPKIGMFLICLGVLLYLSYLSIRNFALRETATGDKYEHLSDVAFPELTLCPSVPYKRDFLKDNGIDDVKDIQFNAKWVSDIPGLTAKEFFKQSIISRDEIFHSGYVDTEQSLNDDTRFYLNGTLVGNCKIDIIWTVKEYYFNGLCYAIRFPQCLHDLGILELVLFFDQATDVFVHHPNQFLSPNSRSRVKIKSSRRRGEIESFKIAATYEIVNLDSSTGKCVDVQDFDGCIYEKLHDIQKTLYNCTVPWLPNRDTICSNPGNSKLAFKSYQNNRRNQQKICPNPCEFTNVYFGPPVEEVLADDSGATCTLVVYFRRDVKVTSEYYLISAISMIAEIGGYASLLLGFSLYNLTEFSEYFNTKWQQFWPKSKT